MDLLRLKLVWVTCTLMGAAFQRITPGLLNGLPKRLNRVMPLQNMILLFNMKMAKVCHRTISKQLNGMAKRLNTVMRMLNTNLAGYMM